ncbi:hypothetical protein [Kosmotoga pacifica]|uniref:Uncharacterized protein n=1 Tax=Kosmotoga pacifica TaxID=1330330 RepID=A0A0G2Z888_9BACT|nr:hypothetical protein [Kosmotoga pacifica]AKI97830.1 hypothetical protein IX53_08415 [Kosmotoga pacifica]
MKRLIIIFLLFISLVAFAGEEELKARLEENPLDFEALQELLELYEENQDYWGYISTIVELTEKLEETYSEIMPYVLQAARYAVEQYYDAEAVTLYTYFLNRMPRVSVLKEFMRELEYLYDYEGTLEDVILNAVSSFDDEKTILEEVHEYADEEYLTYVQKGIERILYKKYGEVEYMIPYLELLLDDGKYDEVKKALEEHEVVLKDKPMFFYMKGVLEVVRRNYDGAYELFKTARIMEEGLEDLERAMDLLDRLYVPDYLIEFYYTLLIDLNEENQIENLKNFATKRGEIKWIASFLEGLPEPVKISEVLQATGTIYAVTEYHLDSDMIYLALLNESGEKLFRSADIDFGKFFSSGILYVDYSYDYLRVVYEGEIKKAWEGYDTIDVSPVGDKFVISSYDYNDMKCISLDFEELWEQEILPYNAYPASWSIDGNFLLVENYDDYTRVLIDAETGETVKTFENVDDYKYLFLGKGEDIYGIDYDGNIQKLLPVKPLLTMRKAEWAVMIDEEDLLYYEIISSFLDNLYLGNLLIYNTISHTEKLIDSDVLFVPSFIPSVKIKRGKLLYVGYRDSEGFLVMYDLNTGEKDTLFRSPKVVLAFPDLLSR